MSPPSFGAGPGAAAKPTSIDSPDMRRADRELLSLALIDARNHTLHLLSLYEQALEQAGQARIAPTAQVTPPIWLAGHIGWFAEWWIARNTQRAYGMDCPVRPTRLASIEPHADLWWNPTQRPPADRWAPDLPDLSATKAYLLETLEATLDLLERAGETDAALYFYRLALFHEDLRGEQLVVMAQALGLPIGAELPPPSTSAAPLLLPATRWRLGLDAGEGNGFVFAQEAGHETLSVPEFEIDAQPVTWQQYVEFVDDGGYDREELWAGEGWRWLQQEGRRAPRYVEQIGAAHRGSGGSVLQQRFGATLRVSGHHSAMHVAWWEADAWARWAGRRVATEAEWEIAATHAARRGFRWGEVREWTAGTLRPFDGFRPDPWSAGTEFDPQPLFGQARVLRGASFATRARLRTLRGRAFALPDADDGFFGFRTCAL
ncbi:SUMF1/EgtB/PvdO family nonheme iron enzyme [Variovorax dokdonensis]|uniref:SUMF1/EgtB/PvdO family nonheme iron enzyme n=2 Tax=Variovorax dokdonensis TaxID=344883 RepID=A0ABT7NC03_9BURK|nr:SUMF1/EgtB/PvdO family nonheme iron enzyme [Variovorax dokdonensis]MDM0045476.1 SUMF1/EgtB/PvdO family nonheme iron enzyme [Variovorax dokdonensis]